MTAPDATLVEALSKTDFPSLGYTSTDELQPVVTEAVAYINMVTGRQWATMPPPLEPIAAQAVVLRTEQIAYRNQEDYTETANDDVVSSFSAGPYSETRHDPNRRGESRSLNSNPALSELLWLLLTPFPGYPDENVEQMWDYWRQLLSGVNAPASSVTEIDWSGSLHFPDWYSQWQKVL